jgi:hypothetical protein
LPATINTSNGHILTYIHMVEVDMNMGEERLLKQRPLEEGMDMAGIHMMQDMMIELEWVKRKHKCVMLAKHWTDNVAEKN